MNKEGWPFFKFRSCPKCGSHNCIKKGFKKERYASKQDALCNDCGRRFIIKYYCPEHKLDYVRKDAYEYHLFREHNSPLTKDNPYVRFLVDVKQEPVTKPVMQKMTGSCMVSDCREKAVWFNLSKTRKTISAKYCDHHFNNWAIPQKIGRINGWVRIKEVV